MTAASDEILLGFLRSPIGERFRLALDPATAPVVESYLGAEEFARYVDLARRSRQAAHLGLGPPNLIFVPGVMGSLLHSEGLAGVWWIDARTRRHIDDLRLSPDGLADANPGHKIRPFSIDTSYEPFLAAVQASNDFSHRFFAYDWRKSLSRSADQLRELIEQTHRDNGGQSVHLVGHSMGGLMIRATLHEHGSALWPIVGRVLFIGTPHYGSPAIASYLKHHFWGFDLLVVLRRYLSRATFRSLWGVMELLPAPIGIYPGTSGDDTGAGAYPHPCVNFDPYDASAWRLDLDSTDRAGLQNVLDGAAAFHRRMHEHHSTLDQEHRNRMAVIAGVGKKTLFRIAYRRGFSRVWREMKKVTEREPGNPHRDGDGRVPLASAQLPYVATVRYVSGVHGNLPNMSPVADDALRWLSGEPMHLPDTPDQALVPHLGATDPDDEDPGYLQFDEPSEQRVAELDAEIEAGQRPEFVLVRPL